MNGLSDLVPCDLVHARFDMLRIRGRRLETPVTEMTFNALIGALTMFQGVGTVLVE